jgi:hypothetical protein
MKKCPVCDKTFNDSMRFCQTDGTPLVEEIPEDPYKTMVAGKDEIAAAIPPPSMGESGDPFKTMVAGGSSHQSKGANEDLLEIPEESNVDPLKTMVNPQSNTGPEEIEIEPIKDAPAAPAPPSPFDNAATPSQPPMQDKGDLFSSAPPSPPKFNEPSIAPPPGFSNQPPADFSLGGFDDSSKSSAAEDKTAIYSSSPLSEKSSEPFSSPSPTPPAMSGEDSPFGKPSDAPISSTFGNEPQSSYETPSSSAPPPFKDAEPAPFGNQNDPFSQSPFGGQAGSVNQNMQQSDWSPPPAPDSNWQNQSVGQNTPFQPPAVATGGEDKTLAIISLVCGILSICLCGVLTGIPAIITGYMAKNNVDANPNQYGGRGMAMAGIILGGVSIVLTILVVILQIMFGALTRF